jgi:hypothetical protein
MSNPASIVIARLGGAAIVSFITGTAYTAPYRWQAARTKGGTGGLIPQRYHRKLIDYASSQGIPLSAEEFLAREDGDAERAPRDAGPALANATAEQDKAKE